MSQDLHDQIALLKARLITQQQLLEAEVRARIALEEALVRAGLPLPDTDPNKG